MFAINVEGVTSFNVDVRRRWLLQQNYHNATILPCGQNGDDKIIPSF
jgi:hypothetical protein